MTLMYNLIEYSKNYSKRSRSFWQYYSDEPNATLTDSESFKCKVIIKRCTPLARNIKDVKITVALKFRSDFWSNIF